MTGEKNTSSGNPGSGGSPLSQPAHTLPCDVVISELGTRLDEGLSNDEAKHRLQQYGQNKLDDGEGVSILKILIRQVANAMMLVKGPTFSCYERPLLHKSSQSLIQFVVRS
jgi:hypothetical protein